MEKRREGEISFFVKDSLTRSFLASVELFHVKRGFTNLGQRRPSPPPPPSPFPPSFTRPRLRHDPFSSFLFFSSLLFPPFPFSFPLLSLSFFFSYHCPGISHLTPPPFVPVEIGRHLADGDFRDRFADSPPTKFAEKRFIRPCYDLSSIRVVFVLSILHRARTRVFHLKLAPRIADYTRLIRVCI